MTDQTKIEPALSAEEWARLRDQHEVVVGDSANRSNPRVAITERGEIVIQDDWGESESAPPAVVVAVANAALPDSDPRKITRHSAWIIRKLLSDATIDNMHPGAMQLRRDAEQLADALESYLPPEGR